MGKILEKILETLCIISQERHRTNFLKKDRSKEYCFLGVPCTYLYNFGDAYCSLIFRWTDQKEKEDF